MFPFESFLLLFLDLLRVPLLNIWDYWLDDISEEPNTNSSVPIWNENLCVLILWWTAEIEEGLFSDTWFVIIEVMTMPFKIQLGDLFPFFFFFFKSLNWVFKFSAENFKCEGTREVCPLPSFLKNQLNKIESLFYR